MKIPRYILDRDAIAKKAGLEVTRKLVEEASFGETCWYIDTEWRGTLKQIRSTNLFPPHLRGPKGKQMLQWWSKHYGASYAVKHGRNSYTLTWHDDEPAKLVTFGNVEAAIYAPDYFDQAYRGYERISVYGSRQILVAEEFISERWIPDKRVSKSRGHWSMPVGSVPIGWKVILQPNGKLLCKFERRFEGRFEPQYTPERVRFIANRAMGKRDPAFEAWLKQFNSTHAVAMR